MGFLLMKYHCIYLREEMYTWKDGNIRTNHGASSILFCFPMITLFPGKCGKSLLAFCLTFFSSYLSKEGQFFKKIIEVILVNKII